MISHHPEIEKIQTLKKWLVESNYTVVLTGAGMSTESGIPDFRSKEGLWNKKDPMEVACVDALFHDYENFYAFYKERVKHLEGCIPHKGYEILAKWESSGRIDSIITQNVDGFHEKAGSIKVYTLHGSIHTFRCSRCQEPASKKMYFDKHPCRKCGGYLRPNVVLFGEALPKDELNHGVEEMKKAELVMVIGTSLQVYPVSQLPYVTKGRRVYINKEISDSRAFDLTIEGRAGEILEGVDQMIGI